MAEVYGSWAPIDPASAQIPRRLKGSYVSILVTSQWPTLVGKFSHYKIAKEFYSKSIY